jgi:hypothetical protein
MMYIIYAFATIGFVVSCVSIWVVIETIQAHRKRGDRSEPFKRYDRSY